ncbi:stage III sporulation protein AF [Desulfolucanica intricata]|uniref:stage III sporulation protein AF n=1 Tax=Desulfolucanica intricata TaxID=1285191 RepID=UPI00082BF99E|nr:stage III sporulation protein AF [Desulfolucanica intricata]
MDIIKTLVQNLIIIVVLTVFLEMLLPSGIMRRYVKVVMGLVVVVSVLQTASGLIHKDLNLSVPAIAKLHDNTEIRDITAAGEKLAKQNQSEALNGYQNGIERQVLAIAGLNDELEVVDVEVDIQDNPENKNYGRIQEINLVVTKRTEKEMNNQDSTIPQVEPVSIQVGDKSEEVKSAKEKPLPGQVEKIRETVASFYNLTADQVQVEYQ